MRNRIGSLDRLALIALTLVALPLGLAAQTPPVEAKPEPAEQKYMLGPLVLARSVEAMGGAEKFGKIKSTRQTLSIDFGNPMLGVKSMDLVMKGKVLDAGTPKERTVWAYRGGIDFGEGIGLAEEGSDGEIVWDLQPMQGPRILEGAERAAKLRSVDPLVHHHWKRYYDAVETVARKTIGKESCLEVRLTPKEGKPELAWFSEKSGLLVRTKSTVETAMGELAITSDLSDYRLIEPVGIRQPYLVTVEIAGMGPPRKVKLKSISYNVEVKDEEIALPAEIVKLAAKEKARAKEKAAEKGDAKDS